MEEIRANADEVLKKVNEEITAQNRGVLKIFFGYAAGVGKTFAMLNAAHEAKANGIDVAIGYVQPHTRPQTMVLLEGLEQLPSCKISYKGIEVLEFDLDLAIKRNPQLIIVDEMAHTNTQGCRHAKRYQDIEELLKLGIDVYTTVNVQHIESLNDIVASITGVMVRERIPDKAFDNAQQVELVDIEPQELIKRLNEGKIYGKNQAHKALGNFFIPENLVALREIALRRCADRVNLISKKSRQEQGGDYHTDEHILVCLSSSPTNAKIIRTAARMSSAFRGRFTALFVETPDFLVTTDENKKRLRANISLAGQLGATIETVYGDDAPSQIAEFARISGVSKIVVGRSNARRKGLFKQPSLTQRLTDAAPSLDIYIIPDKDLTNYKPERAKVKSFSLNYLDILKSLGVLLLATGIGFIFEYLGFSEANIITVYILGVLIAAIVTSHRVYSLVLSVFCVITFNFFFTIPKYTLQAYDSGYPITFFIMFLSAFITGTLAVRIKQHAQMSTQRAHRTQILLDTNQLLQKCVNKNSVIEVISNQLAKLLNRDIVFYPIAKAGLQSPIIVLNSSQPQQADFICENEKAVATWVFNNNKRAGASTNTLGNAKCLYLAVRVNDAVYGVVGIVANEEPLDAFENSIVLSILGECALALENLQIIKEREEAAVLAKNEQLRANILRSISHDLRTPLTAISGNAGILLSSEDAISKEKRKILYADIYDDSLWLINLVENLLSVTRIEDGSMRLNLTAELIEEVLDEALNHISRKKFEHTIQVVPADSYIIAKIDARLIVQVIINIVDNAIKYTPIGSKIIISTRKENGFAIIEIADNGDGVTAEVKEKIFDMFYTAGSKIADSRRSLGLGLSLCKSIITAHGGTIYVKNNKPNGTIFTFTLPLEEVPLHE